MSRIYEGGQSQNTYKGTDRTVKYNPTQVVSEEKKVKEEGQQKLRDLQTKDRQAQRQDQFASLELQAEQKVQNLDLQIMQAETKNQHEQQLTVEKSNLQTDQLAAKADLKMSQTVESFSQASEQLADKNALSLNQLRASNSLKLEHQRENVEMKQQHAAIKADNQLAATHQQLSHQVDRANTALMQTAISAVIKFGGVVAEEVAENNEKKKVEDAALEWFNSDNATVITPDGGVNPIVEADNQEPEVLAAYEQGVQQVAARDNLTAVEADAIRTPARTQRGSQNVNTIGVNDAAIAIPSVLTDAWNNGTKIQLPNGAVLDPRAMSGAQEVSQWAKAVVGDFVTASGLASMDSAAVAKTLLPSAVNSVTSFTTKRGAEVVQGLQETSISLANQRAATSIDAGQVPLSDVWNQLSGDYFLSGKYSSRAESNEAAVKALLPYLSVDELKHLKTVYKKAGNKGTELGIEYGPLIDNAITKARKGIIEEQRLTSSENTFTVAALQEQHTSAVLAATTPEEVQQAHLNLEAGLLANKSPEALKEYQTQLAISNFRDPFALGELIDRAQAGNPITVEEGKALLNNGTLTTGDYKTLEQSGGLANSTAIASANLIKDDVKAAVTGQVVNALDDAGIPMSDKVADRSLAPIITDIQKRAMQALVAYNAENEGILSEGQQREFIRQWSAANVPDMLKNVGWDGATATVTGYTFTGTAPALKATTTVYNNPITNKPSRSLTAVPTSTLKSLYQDNTGVTDFNPTGTDVLGNDISPVNDRLLTKAELAATVEAIRVGQPVPARVDALSKITGLTPKSLAIYQGMGQGLDVESVLSEPPTTQGPTDTASGAKYIQSSLGFPPKGAAYLSANIAQESSWDGMRDWPQVLGDGTSRNGGLVSWASWSNDPARLGFIENYLGKDISQATHAEQLDAMHYEMKTNYKEVYRIFMNPRATDAQLRRMSYQYWGYGEEGINRFGVYLSTAKRAVGLS